MPVWILALIAALVLALAGMVVLIVTHEGTAKSTRSYPDHWDKRIAPYVKIAEKKRGLTFLHPVEVRFLPAAEYEKDRRIDEEELDDKDRAELEQATGLMRALGLITGDVDLFDALNNFYGSGSLAYYSFEDERITIRGQTVTPSVRATLVHELTHVLQDQHFRVGDKLEKLSKESEDAESSPEGDILDAIVEGDAERIEGLYRDSLTEKQRKALDAGRKDEYDQASKQLEKIPTVLVTMLTSSYTLGESLVQAVAADGGNAAVDDLFYDPPTHETSLLDPFEVLAGDSDVVDVDVPGLQDGEKKIDSGEFGVLTWYFMLAERLPLRDALAAADGWAGDAYVSFEGDDDVCARMTYAGQSGQDTTRMFSALQRWVAAAPGSPAEVRRDGDVLRFESCDPGKAADVGKDASEDAVRLVTARTYLGLGIRQVAPDDVARCMAGKMVQTYRLSQLVDPNFGHDDPAVAARIQQLLLGCR